MAMSPPLEKRYPVSDGIYHPPLVGDGNDDGDNNDEVCW
jgi:hypothetical protein